MQQLEIHKQVLVQLFLLVYKTLNDKIKFNFDLFFLTDPEPTPITLIPTVTTTVSTSTTTITTTTTAASTCPTSSYRCQLSSQPTCGGCQSYQPCITQGLFMIK